MLSHGYVLTLRTAKRFLQDAYPIHSHIDGWMSIYSYIHDVRIVASSQLQLKQHSSASTDIQSKDACAICTVPTDFTKEYTLVAKSDLFVARASEIAVVLLIGYLVYQQWKK